MGFPFRLTDLQRDVIDGLFFEGSSPADLAARRSVSASTIYNTSVHAKSNLRRDDCFFAALYKLGIVCDRARAASRASLVPQWSRLPDGRRIVHIDQAD